MQANSFCKENNKNLKSAEKGYKSHHDRHVRFPPYLNELHKLYMDRPLLFRSAAETSVADGYRSLQPTKQGPYKVVCENVNMIKVLHDELQYVVSIHRASRAPTLKRYSDRPNEEE